ncbi:unnamed protein product [Hydatigera taeniaeformis]|uniref:HCO3_cotransp domain-containing protein n=1 Tax=Hydatigena taeniaeformis TaxID=6205 RepID=A0A0R3WTG6_HYDTA|nr:unnamed protein product [Hydatigera taeniaeformis]
MFMVEVRREQRDTSPSVNHYLPYLVSRLRKEFSPEDEANTSASISITSLFLIVAPFAVPAILYTVTNNMDIFIQMEMDPATYQVHS